jgi:hypothetical protein
MIKSVRYFLGLLAAVALIAGVTKIGYDRFEDEIRTRTNTAEAGPTAAVTTTAPEVLPAANQVFVAGTVANAHAETALIDPLALPLTITAQTRGAESSATFTGVTVDGKAASIHWDAGTPLQLAGSGSLVPGAGTLDIDTSSISFTFGKRPQGIAPGDYTINSPVAVSIGKGLAQPHQSVSFKATSSAAVIFTGAISTSFPTRTFTAKGPGKVVLTGSLAVVQPDGAQASASSATLDAGPFQLQFLPAGDNLTVKATLQGAVTTV